MEKIDYVIKEIKNITGYDINDFQELSCDTTEMTWESIEKEFANEIDDEIKEILQFTGGNQNEEFNKSIDNQMITVKLNKRIIKWLIVQNQISENLKRKLMHSLDFSDKEDNIEIELPLKIIEEIDEDFQIIKYPLGYNKIERMDYMESIAIFNLNDICPAFYTLGNRLVKLNNDNELRDFLKNVSRIRYKDVIGKLIENDIHSIHIHSSHLSESFLSSEELQILKKWKQNNKDVLNAKNLFQDVIDELDEIYDI